MKIPESCKFSGIFEYNRELDLINIAVSDRISVGYVLFDCWFANSAQIIVIRFRGKDCIVMIKKSSCIQYLYEGWKQNIKQINTRNKQEALCKI